jgi:hypothetical protein
MMEMFRMFNEATERKADKPLGTNPKDRIGSTKVSITKLPAAGVIHGAHAMVDGAEKYGPFNWRDNKVIASIYVDAAIRHLLNWFEGQELATDSEVHHLGHAIACCAILLDAQETGNLVDDRPVCGDPDVADRILNRLAAIIKRRKEAKTVTMNFKPNDLELPIANPPMKGPVIDALASGFVGASVSPLALIGNGNAK